MAMVMDVAYRERVDRRAGWRQGKNPIDFSWGSTVEAEECIRDIEELTSQLRALKRQLRATDRRAGLPLSTANDYYMQEVDELIFRLCLAKVSIGKQRYEQGSYRDDGEGNGR